VKETSSDIKQLSHFQSTSGHNVSLVTLFRWMRS